MIRFLQKRWFLVALALLIPLGLVWGMRASATNPWGKLLGPIGPLIPQLTTGFVLFLMAFSLDTHHLREAVRSPGPVLLASVLNFVFVPLMCWGLAGFQALKDFEVGLLIAGSVPCTLAAASVWTRKAHGNDAVSLMVTLLTNVVCFLVTPFWLNLTTGQGITLDSGRMVVQLLIVVLLPTLAGQSLRQIPRLGEFGTKNKTPLGVLAQGLILFLVFVAALKAGKQLAGSGPSPSIAAVTLVWGSCLVVHLIAMRAGWIGGGLLGFARENRAAIVFAGSQKTLPIGVLIATDPTMFGNLDLLGPGQGVPFAVFPMLMYHASQLFIDTAVADRIAEGGRMKDEG